VTDTPGSAKLAPAGVAGVSIASAMATPSLASRISRRLVSARSNSVLICASCIDSERCVFALNALNCDALATEPLPSVPLASTGTALTGPVCAAVLASMSPMRTELPDPPSTWLAAVVVPLSPLAVEKLCPALEKAPTAVARAAVALASAPTTVALALEAVPTTVARCRLEADRSAAAIPPASVACAAVPSAIKLPPFAEVRLKLAFFVVHKERLRQVPVVSAKEIPS
jgi:hypothetical protein